MRVLLALALVLTAAPAGAQPLGAQPLGAALAEAARTGDVKQHEALKGSALAQPVTVTRVWRDGHIYRDLLVTAATDPARPEAQAFSLLVRVPVKLLEGTPPKTLFIRGQVTDFEPVPVAGKLTWLPFVLATALR